MDIYIIAAPDGISNKMILPFRVELLDIYINYNGIIVNNESKGTVGLGEHSNMSETESMFEGIKGRLSGESPGPYQIFRKELI